MITLWMLADVISKCLGGMVGERLDGMADDGHLLQCGDLLPQYYLSTLAPAICALFGIGIVVMWRDYRRSGWRGWLLPLALMLTAIEQIHIIMSDPSGGMWLIPLIAIPCAIAAGVLFAARLIPRFKLGTRVLIPALCIGLLGLMLTSAVWSTIPVVTNQAADLPIAGSSGQAVVGNRAGTSSVDTALVRYLEAHKGSAKYLDHAAQHARLVEPVAIHLGE